MNKFRLKQLVVCLILTQAPNVYSEDLMTIYHQALEADPEARSAALNMEITKEQTGAALGEMLPQISGSANWSGNDNTNPAARPANTTYMGTRYFVSLNQTQFFSSFS